MLSDNTLNLWLKFKLKDVVYAVDCGYVKSLLPAPKITPISTANSCILGISKIDERIETIIELRKLFNMCSLEDEILDFCNMLQNRKSDHIKWVSELEESILNKKPFNLTDDPHKCAFGKWYYKFTSPVISVQTHFKRIEDPHTKLHKLASGVNSLISDAKQNEKELSDILKQADNIKNKLVTLIEESETVYRNSVKEMLISLENSLGVEAGILVDEIVGIEPLEMICSGSEVSAAATNGSENFIKGIGHDKKDKDSIILIIDSEKILKFLNLQDIQQTDII